MHVPRTLLRNSFLHAQQIKLAGQIQSHTPVKPEKVQDKIIWINTIDSFGEKSTVPCFQGESLLYSLKKNDINIVGHCNGGDQQASEIEDLLDNLRFGPACSQCQVIVHEPWLNYLNEMGETEYTRLILAPNREITPKTRLACCVRVEDWMNGMIISLVDTSDPYQMEDLPDKTGTGHLRDKTI